MQSLTYLASVEAPTLRNTYDFLPDFFLIWPRSRYCPLRRLAAAAARPSLRLGRPCRPWLPCYQLTRVEAPPIPHLLVKLVLSQREPLLTRLLVGLGLGLGLLDVTSSTTFYLPYISPTSPLHLPYIWVTSSTTFFSRSSNSPRYLARG